MEKSRIIQGLMRIDSIDEQGLYELIRFDLDNGIRIFDLADIYGDGEAERKLGRVLAAHPELRKEMVLQSKVSIRRGEGGNYYDLSHSHIKEGVEGILSRLGVDHLDILLLHRPDIFLDAKEVDKAFEELREEGKVARFGVSNFSAGAIDYLLQEVKTPIEFNQVQLGLGHVPMIAEAFNFNVNNEDGLSKSLDSFFYMKKKGIGIQAWSPFMVGFFEGSLFDGYRYPRINEALGRMAEKYQSSKCAVATAFLLRLDPSLCVVTGSLNPEHVRECLDGEKIELSKEDWYYLYRESGHSLP